VGVRAGTVKVAPLVGGGGGRLTVAQAIGKPSANTKIANRIGVLRDMRFSLP
jgi:hypothetical protein